MIKKALSLTNILLITIAIFFGVKLFYVFVAARLDAATQKIAFAVENQQTVAKKNSVEASPVTQKKQYAFYQPIIDRDLFKTVKPKVQKTLAPSELEKLQKTRLNLTLWGTIVDNTGQCYAVIEDAKTKKQRLYKEGDSIQDARIKAILREKVVLTVNGKDEILEMKNVDDQSHRISASRQSSRNGGPEYPVSGDMEKVSIDRSTITHALNNINDLMRQVRIRPYYKDGKPNGILVSSIQKGSIFQNMGLRNGDIVTGVNGHPIQSMDDAMKFYNYLKLSDRVELQIQRQGETKTIYYQIH